MLKVDDKLLVHSFIYEEYLGKGKKGESLFAEPIVIEKCRIDGNIKTYVGTNNNQITYDSILFCYSDFTTPFVVFKERSKVTYNNKEKVIQKVVEVAFPYRDEIFAYELEVL